MDFKKISCVLSSSLAYIDRFNFAESTFECFDTQKIIYGKSTTTILEARPPSKNVNYIDESQVRKLWNDAPNCTPIIPPLPRIGSITLKRPYNTVPTTYHRMWSLLCGYCLDRWCDLIHQNRLVYEGWVVFILFSHGDHDLTHFLNILKFNPTRRYVTQLVVWIT